MTPWKGRFELDTIPKKNKATVDTVSCQYATPASAAWLDSVFHIDFLEPEIPAGSYPIKTR